MKAQTRLFILFLALGVAGSAVMYVSSGCSSLLPALVRIGHTTRLAGGYLELIEHSAQIWEQAHPEDLSGAQQLRGAIKRTRAALTALDALIGVGASSHSGDVAQAKLELLRAYGALYQLAVDMDLIRLGDGPLMAPMARTGQAPPVRPKVIKPDELEALLQTE